MIFSFVNQKAHHTAALRVRDEVLRRVLSWKCILLQEAQASAVKCSLVGGLQVYRRGNTTMLGLSPSVHAQAPPVAITEAREGGRRVGAREVVATLPGEGKEC